MSRAGAAERGFTLIELLVALTIVALAAALVAPQFGRLARPDIDRTARQVALAVREVRTEAQRTGRVLAVAPDGLAPLLPTGTRLEAVEPGGSGPVFFPTGASSGGRLVLAAADGRRAVAVDWLTGQVAVERLP